MILIDLLGDVQAGRERLNLPNLRKAASRTMQDSLLARERAMAALGFEPTEDVRH